VQIPNDNCGASGLASHGVLGISVGKSLFDEQQYNRSTSDQLQQVFFYEAHRNFWPEWFNNKFDWAMDNDPDSWGWWTVAMNNAMVSIMAPLIGVEGMYGDQTGIEFRNNMVAQLRSCIDGNYNWSTGWTHKFMDWNPTESINDLMTGLLNYSFENFGGMEWLAGFYAGIKNPSIPDRSNTLAYQECRDNVYKIWSVAADSNLLSFFSDTLQWSISQNAVNWVEGQLDPMIFASESFEYSHLSNIDNASGGSGWSGSWALAVSNGTAQVTSGSLSYNGVATSGGKLRLEPSGDTPEMRLERPLDDTVSSGTVWVTWLMKADVIGNGHLFLRPNGVQAYGVGKRWGTDFAIDNDASDTTMTTGRTYLVVAKIEVKSGNDEIYLWINPSLSQEPAITNADVVKTNTDIGELGKIDIMLQGYGQGEYEIDEIRLGATFLDAISGGTPPPAEALTSEPFDYGHLSNIDNASGGSGWNGSWALAVSNGTAQVTSGSLSYNGVATSGGKLRLEPSGDTPEMRLERSFDTVSNGTVWVSWLVKADVIGNGHLFLRPNGVQAYGVGKRWGADFAIDNDASDTTMTTGRTYLMVARVEVKSGNDDIYFWINPSLSQEPDTANADVAKTSTDLGALSKIDIVLQGYGQGEYEIDEIRIAETFAGTLGTQSLPYSDRKVVMWIGAHPDDELFGAHAAFARYIKESGNIGHYINVTSGSVQYNPSTTTNYEHGMERMGEAYTSARSVQADNRFMCMIDGQVINDIYTLEERLTRAIREIQPDIVITHGPGGEYGNADHVATSNAATAAVAAAAIATAYPSQLAEGLKTWNTPKYYRIKYDPYPSADSLTLNIDEDVYSALLGDTYAEYADSSLRASHVTAENVGIFDTYPVPDYTKGSIVHLRDDISLSGLETDLFTGLGSVASRPEYIRDWVVIGSWSGDIGSNVLGVNEQDITSPLGLTHGGKTWTAYAANNHSLVNFRQTFSPNTNAVAYAYTELELDAPISTYLRIAANNKYKIWLNGTLLHTQSTIPDYDYEKHIAVNLLTGVNRILVKMETAGAYASVARPWGFFMKAGTGADSPAPVSDGDPHILVMPAESYYNMGDATVGNGYQNTVNFKVRNIDLADNLSVSGISLGGTNPGDFVIHNDSGESTLAPWGERTFQLSFDPQSATPKARSAQLTISSNDPARSSISISLIGDALEGLSMLMMSATEKEGTASVAVFPNPVVTTLTVRLGGGSHAWGSIVVFDQAGKPRYVNREVSGAGTIDMSGMEPGVYFIRIVTNAGTTVKKVVKLK
jgi:LmbE family N-acetylglucosaminyl deacetylase